VKGFGEDTVIEQELEDFNKLYLGPRLRFDLVQDTINKIVIRGGENVIGLVKAELIDGKLSITNENKCNFLRSFKKKINVELHLKKIQNIEFDATEPAYCSNTLLTDYLSVTINESAGRLHLDLNAEVLYTVVNRSWGNFEVVGNVNYYKAQLRGNAFGNTTGLSVLDSIHVITRSGSDLEINADGALLRTQIHSVGNIGYIGTPVTIDHRSFGEGELLNKN
jgi:hypothetical protein